MNIKLIILFSCLLIQAAVTTQEIGPTFNKDNEGNAVIGMEYFTS